MLARALPLTLLLPAVLFAAGCGDTKTNGANKAERVDSAPAAPEAAFPAVEDPDGKVETVLKDAQTGGPEFAPSVSVLEPGNNRIGFGLFNKNGTMAREDAVALYVVDTDGTHPKGPYTARRESLTVAPAFRSKQTATEETPYVYVTTVPFQRPGKYGVVAVVKRDGKLLASEPRPLDVQEGSEPPDAGQPAPSIKTLTPQDVGGDLSKLTTRQPPLRSLVSTNIAAVLGRKPIVLGFATPQLCQTRICGPVVDVMAELQSRYGDRVAFVQQEIYKDDNPAKGLRPQLSTYRLESEPWTYVIDRQGQIAARFEGALSTAELEAAVRGVAQ